MPTDRQVLDALGHVTGCPLFFFEQVHFRGSEDHAKPVFLCIGKSAAWFVNASVTEVSSSLPPSGRFLYEHLEKVVLPNSASKNNTDLRFVLSKQRPQGSPAEVDIVSEYRSDLLTQMEICFRADGMEREGKMLVFPKYEDEARPKKADLGREVQPFQGYDKKAYKGYTFFLPDAFRDVPTSVAKSGTGSYRAKLSDLQLRNDGKAKPNEDPRYVDVTVHVYDPIPIADLCRIGWDHIRWVGQEYKQALVKSQDTIVEKNKHYMKKMNLTNDPAAWIGWELVVRDKGTAMVTTVMLLRRLYVPPLMDTVQDSALVFKCHELDYMPQTGQQVSLELIAHLAADSYSSEAINVSLYPEVIEAKLDALLYDEEGFSFLKSRTRLEPKGKYEINKFAYVFLKGILKILADENVLANLSLKELVDNKLSQLSKNDNVRSIDLEPMEIAEQMLSMGERVPKTRGKIMDSASDDRQEQINFASKHAWHMRVGRYFAFCIDGGLLGSKFTLNDIVQFLAHDQMTNEADKTLSTVVSFMLHLRPKDWRLPWEDKPLKRGLTSANLLDYTFNDRVMQVLLELGYIKRLLVETGAKNGKEDYAKLLTALLLSDVSSVSLKASICRQIVTAHDKDQAVILCKGLLDVMTRGGPFLATYSCAALVNLSQTKEVVKNYIMTEGVAQICADQLSTYDDDLTRYTLMLLVHLTKSIKHRAEVKATGMLQHLVDMLKKCNETNNIGILKIEAKRQIVTELCSVLGQLCNDEETRADLCENYSLLETLQNAFDNTKESEFSKVQSKVIFALKQCCVNSDENKDTVGSRVIKPIVENLKTKEKNSNHDWACNAILLLLLLCIRPNNCRAMSDAKWPDTFKALSETPLGQKIDVTREKIQLIHQRVMENRQNLSTKRGMQSGF